MRTPHLVFAMLILSVSLTSLPRLVAAQAVTSAAAALMEAAKAWDQACMRRDAGSVGRLLADDYVLTDASGAKLTKKEYLASIVKSPEISRVKSWASENLDVRVLGETATVTGESGVKGRPRGRGFALPARYRFTDTWIRRDGRWLAVSTKATRIDK